MSRRSLSVRTCLATWLVVLLFTSTAAAQDVPFAFLIVNGWKALYGGHAVGSDQNLTSWYGRGQIHVIVNGQKGADVGTARMHVFTRAVPEPGFAAIGPLAGLMSMTFGSYRAHLTVIETPTGLKTTVAFLDAPGLLVDTRVSGVWVLGDGSVVGGGTADDLVVGGIVHFGTPQPLTNVQVSLWPYFPQQTFHNDPPFEVFSSPTGLKWQVGSGSSYANLSPGPVRSYMRADVGSFFDDFTSAISVWHASGDNYVILSCSWNTAFSKLTPFQNANGWDGCSVSGTGPLGSRITGKTIGYEFGQLGARVMTWSLFLAP